MKQFHSYCWAVLLLALPSALQAEDFVVQPQQVLALEKLTLSPVTHQADGFADDGGLKALFFDGLSWKGKPTRVFAWLGIPAKREGKVPGMVLSRRGRNGPQRMGQEMERPGIRGDQHCR